MEDTHEQASNRPALLRDLLELGKARLSLLVVATTAVGFIVAGAGAIDGVRLLATIIGTGFTSSGALALNQWMERSRDALMLRTRNRPLPSGRITQRHAILLSIGSILMGLGILSLFVNRPTAALACSVVLIYSFLYTPMKSRTPLCTLVGAVCGAIPPVMGWVAASSGISIGAWILAATLFTWQIPHFLSLAWLYREDYERGGFRMLPVVDRSGSVTSRMVVLYILALIAVGLSATYFRIAGFLFMAGSFLLGAGLLVFGVRLYLRRSLASARMLFLASLIYLPLLLGLLVADRRPAPILTASVVQESPESRR